MTNSESILLYVRHVGLKSDVGKMLAHSTDDCFIFVLNCTVTSPWDLKSCHWKSWLGQMCALIYDMQQGVCHPKNVLLTS